MKAKIHTLLFLGFTGLALPLSGCIVDNGNNSPPPSCPDLRFATVAWTITKKATQAPLNCAQANASQVVLNFGNYGPYLYPCTDYTGATDAGLPPGDYLFSMQLLAPDGTILSDTSVNNPPVTYPIFSCSQDDIPTVAFDVL